DSDEKAFYQFLPVLEDELKKMVNDGIISKITEPTKFVNPIVLVSKPNGKLRICLDSAVLNKAIVREYQHLSTFEELTSELTKKSTPLTTFATRFKFLRLPFGLSCVPEIFHRIFCDIFKAIKGVKNYIDDLIVYAKRIKERDKILSVVTEIKYVGHTLSSNGIFPDNDKIEAIAQIPEPTCAKELSRFLADALSKADKNFTIKETAIEAQVNLIDRIHISKNQFKNLVQETQTDEELNELLILKHITSLPRYPQSNGFIERHVQIINKLFKKATYDNKDVHISLLKYRNTPIAPHLPSPAQLLFGRRLNDYLPVSKSLLTPSYCTQSYFNHLWRTREVQQQYYDFHSKSLAPLAVNDKIMVQLEPVGKWHPAKIVEIDFNRAKSYLVQLREKNKRYYRNSRFLRNYSTDNFTITVAIFNEMLGNFLPTQTANPSNTGKEKKEKDNANIESSKTLTKIDSQSDAKETIEPLNCLSVLVTIICSSYYYNCS
ncbi:hypothetical protein ILUMI_10978, partial [Ignelater luminosus]